MRPLSGCMSQEIAINDATREWRRDWKVTHAMQCKATSVHPASVIDEPHKTTLQKT